MANMDSKKTFSMSFVFWSCVILLTNKMNSCYGVPSQEAEHLREERTPQQPDPVGGWWTPQPQPNNQGQLNPGQQNTPGQPNPGQQNTPGQPNPGQQNTPGQPNPGQLYNLGQPNLGQPNNPGQLYNFGQPNLGQPNNPGQSNNPGQPQIFPVDSQLVTAALVRLLQNQNFMPLLLALIQYPQYRQQILQQLNALIVWAANPQQTFG